MKVRYESRGSLLIVVCIICLITGSCESNIEEKDPFKVISLEPLSDEIPFEELGAGKILFQRASGIFIIDIDQKITYGFKLNSFVQMPYISPDGSKIASVIRLNDQKSIYGICSMNIDGTNCIPVTNNGGGFCPRWSPDGFKILYYTTDDYGSLQMLSATENSKDKVEVVSFYYYDDPDWVIIPSGGFSMSADGQLICASDGGSKTTGILKIEPYIGKSGVSVLLPNTIGEHPLASVYSPDGTKIAYAIQEIDSFGDQQAIWIKTMDPDGTNHTSLARVKISNEAIIYSLYPYMSRVSLCWSPDSKRILFSAPNELNDGFHLMLVNTDGSGLIQVTDKVAVDDLHVSWGR